MPGVNEAEENKESAQRAVGSVREGNPAESAGIRDLSEAPPERLSAKETGVENSPEAPPERLSAKETGIENSPEAPPERLSAKETGIENSPENPPEKLSAKETGHRENSFAAPEKEELGNSAENTGSAGKDKILSTVTPEEDALTARETIRDMAAGVVFFSLIFAGAGCIIMDGARLRWVLGVLLGGFTAGVLLWHLYVTIDRALDMDEEAAGKYTKRSAMKRLLIAAAAFLAGGLLPQVFHIIGVLLGTFSLKFSAYLQPLTHKVIKFLSKGG